MRLDHQSLDKLLDLMIMIFKWQMFLMSSADDLLNITLRHLHGVGRLMPEQGKMIIIDQANQFFYDKWNHLNDEKRYGIVRRLNRFLTPFNIRISLLIRMKLQVKDGTFIDKVAGSSNEFFRYYVHNLGENIYEKLAHFPQCKATDSVSDNKEHTHEIDCLFQQFNVDLNEVAALETVATRLETGSKETVAEPRNTLDELKKKCKMDEVEDPKIEDDNFQDLLAMLDKNLT